ncbi:MAG: NAD(P)/FAD-dependent oxidoreductase [Ectobacillus sp.]
MYDCVIIGAGIAGLQAAIQLGRYRRDVLVVDAKEGRSVICRNYSNILGWPEGVSGQELRCRGKQQAERYGVAFAEDKIISVSRNQDIFILEGTSGHLYKAKTILIATGIKDRIPEIRNLKACLGLTVYICPDCDGYEVSDKRVIIMGANEAGANLAKTLTYWTNEIIYVNHDGEDLHDATKEELEKLHIQYVKSEIAEVIVENEASFKGVKLQNGDVLHAERGFIAFGGNQVHTELAEQLGVHLADNNHIMVNPRTKETNVANVWAAGDIVAHSEQVTIAMGDGSQAAVWIHKKLLLILQERNG